MLGGDPFLMEMNEKRGNGLHTQMCVDKNWEQKKKSDTALVRKGRC